MARGESLDLLNLSNPWQTWTVWQSAGHPAAVVTDDARVYLADTDGFVVFTLRWI